METELNLQSHGNFTDTEKHFILLALDSCEKEYKIHSNEHIGLCKKLKYRLFRYIYTISFFVYITIQDFIKQIICLYIMKIYIVTGGH